MKTTTEWVDINDLEQSSTEDLELEVNYILSSLDDYV